MFSALTTFLISLTSSCAALLYRHKMIEPGGLLDWLPNYFPENDKWRGLFECAVCLSGWLSLVVMSTSWAIGLQFFAQTFVWMDVLWIVCSWICTPVLTTFLYLKTWGKNR